MLVGMKRNKSCNAIWHRKRRLEGENREKFMAYPRRWIERAGPIAWPPRSPDLIFLWGHFKLLVYATPMDTPGDLIARIIVAAADINSIPGIFECVRESFSHRCRLCNDASDRHFHQLVILL
ncbi:hypothetical protein AVEN_18436-1 [Araneus ventricosus]|uniref:Uncharacterized protein n=1 Tax=Araneus ventricosus TaxID=182803 RepID=A0A4Y2G8L2_ARAVE|nr:hypothetical protein AVEN_18436-1 [Araneus ventricosus]